MRNSSGLNTKEKQNVVFRIRNIAPKFREDKSIETALLLKEVLDRINIPPTKDISGTDDLETLQTDMWNIPNTEIDLLANVFVVAKIDPE